MIVRLIARREIVTRIQQRGYRVGFGIALLLVIAACVVPSFFDDTHAQSYDVGVAVSVPGFADAAASVARAQDATVHLRQVDAATARKQVGDGDLDAALLAGNTIVAKERTGAAVVLVQTAFRLAATVDRLERAGLTPAQVGAALNVPAATVRTTSSDNTERQTIAVFAVIVLFSQLITFCTWVATGVVEEKASRVVELMLSAVRPLQLLAGKLLGIGLLAATQVFLLGVTALVAGSLAGTLTLPASAVATVAVSFGGFVLGFAFFAALAAGLASTVSRQEEVSGVLTPVTLTITVCYFASFAATSSPDTTLARVLSIVPPVSAIAMPGRIAHGGVPWYDIALAVALLVAAAALITALAARVYRASVLHSGTRVRLLRAWKGEAVAS